MFKALFRTFVFSILLALVLFGFPSSSMSQGVEAWTNRDLYGGRIFEIAIDPTNPDKMFAGSYMGDGLFVTEDGGSTWQAVETENEPEREGTFKDHAVWAVKMAPSNHNVIWVAHNQWVEKSTDGGQTWTHIWNSTMQRDCTDCGGEGDNFRFCRSLAVDRSDPQRVYVGTGGPYGTDLSGAVYKTEDGGETWTKMNDGSDFDFGVVDMDIDPQNNNTIWAVTDSAGAGGVWGGTLYRSGDGGETWSPIFSLTPSGARYFTVAVKPNDPNVVFTGSGPGIIKHYSLDGGVTWDWEYPIEWDSSYVQDLQFDPQDPETLYASWYRRDHPGWAVGRSSEGGESGTWKIYTTPNNDFCSLAVHPRNTKDRVTEVIFAGDFNLGIYKGVYDSQADDYSWTPVNNGINAIIVYDVAIDPNDRDHVLAGTFSGVYEKRAEEAWSHILEYSTRSVQFHPTNSQIFYAGLEGQLARTMNGGESWTFSNYLGWFNCFNDIAIDPTNTDTIFIAASYGEIYKSTDGGDTLNKVLDGVNQSGENYAFNVVMIDPSDSQHIFAGGGNFYAPKVLGDLWESTNGGDTWDRTSLQNVIVNALLIDPQNPDLMYAGCGYSGGTEVPLYKSTDGGDSWTASYEGIPGMAISLMDVWGASAADSFAVGVDGTILHYDGTWSAMVSDTTKTLNGIWGAPATDVFAVGANGTIVHYDGTWSTMSSGTTKWLNDIWGASATDVFAVGVDGTILHYDGTWSAMVSDTTKTLNGIWGASATDIFAVGVDGTILHYNGTWSAISSGTTQELEAVWGTSATDIFTVGNDGTIVHYDGTTWAEMDSGTTEYLLSVWGTSGADVFVVGDRGGIFHYNGSAWSVMRPGGEYWNVVTDLEFHRENTNVIYASTNAAGVYISPNRAGNWLNLGTPEYDVYAISTSSLYAATQGGLLQCTGTGVIAGQVINAITQAGIDNATVLNDLGAKTISINGEYMMVSPAGFCEVTAIASIYENKTISNVTVHGGNVTWTNIPMQIGVSDPSAADGGDTTGGGGGGCLITTTADGFRMAKNVETVLTFIGVCILIGCMGFVRRFKFRCKKT